MTDLKGKWIELSDRDVDVARVVGQGRRKASGSRADIIPTTTAQAVDAEMVGCLTEMAVCRDLGQPWASAIYDQPDPHRPDALPDWQVRGTRYVTGHLPVHRRNPIEHRYALAVVHHNHLVRIVGWLPGRIARVDKWWRDMGRGPAWCVPQWALTTWGAPCHACNDKPPPHTTCEWCRREGKP